MKTSNFKSDYLRLRIIINFNEKITLTLILISILLSPIFIQAQTSITVNTNTVIASGVKGKYGINLNAGIDSDANRSTGARPLYKALIEMGVKHLRFPGGEKSDYYIWAAPPYTSAATASWVTSFYSNAAKNTMNFDQFMNICSQTGAEAHINVAYNPAAGLNENLAAEWVRYSNKIKNYGVKYWEVGNEMWATDKGLTAAQLAVIAVNYATAMKNVDSTIKVGVSWNNQAGYQTILQTAGNKLDFVTCSNYTISSSWSSYSTYANTANLDLFANGARAAINAVKTYGNNKSVVLSEFNAISWYTTNWSNGNDLGHALVNFETIGQIMTDPKINYGCLWNTRWYGEEGNSYTIYTALDSNNYLHAAAIPLAVWGKFIQDQLVSISNTTSIKTYAAYNSNSGDLNIFLENKSTSPQTVTIPITSINNYNSSSEVWQLKGTGINDISPTWSKTGSLNVVNNKTDNIILPATSVTVIALTKFINQFPKINITSPVNNANYTSPANIILEADASDSDGSVRSVSFYYGSTLLSTDTLAPFTYNWNNVGSGNYSIYATATDDHGAIKTSDPITFKVNDPVNNAPTITITSPDSNAVFVSPANIVITANAADIDGTISNVSFYNGNTYLGSDSVAPFTFDWSSVVAGYYSISARATDDHGAITTSEVISVIVNDPVNNAPNITINSPDSNSVFVSPANIVITANAFDVDGTISNVSFYNGNTYLGSDSVAPFTFDWSSVVAGEYSITATATNDHGAITTSEAISVIVNDPVNNTPTISITGPDSGSTFISPANITIIANASDVDGTISNVSFYNGSSLLGSDSLAPFSFDWTGVASGEYSIIATATDDQGAMTTSETIIVIVNDPVNNAPTISITGPDSNSTFISPANINLTANAADDDGTINRVSFYNGINLLGSDTIAPFSFDWTNVATGEYSISAIATDNRGAMTTAETITIKVNDPNNLPPTITITGPDSNATYTSPATIVITANASDSDGKVSSVTFYNGNNFLESDTTEPFTFTWNNITAGKYTITATAKDNNSAITTSDALNITVNNLTNNQPAIIITSPSIDTNIVIGQTLILKADVADPNGNVIQVIFRINDKNFSKDKTQPYTSSWTPTEPGTYFITARAIEKGGPLVSEVRTIIVTSNQDMSGMVNLDPSSANKNPNTITETDAIISPNPTEDEFQLIVKDDVQSICLTNSNGIQVFALGNISANEIITLGNNLSGGLYIIKIIHNSGKVEIKKIQKI